MMWHASSWASHQFAHCTKTFIRCGLAKFPLQQKMLVAFWQFLTEIPLISSRLVSVTNMTHCQTWVNSCIQSWTLWNAFLP